jgi:hypothetical protein
MQKLARLKAVMPMKVHLKKFMAAYVDLHPTYKASSTDVFGTYLYQLFNDRYSIPQSKPAALTEQIIIEIPHLWVNRSRLDVTDKEIRLFNDFVEQMFYQQFYMWMDISVSMGSRMDMARYQFCEVYGLMIDVDINDETLKKRYDRFCKNRISYPNPFKLSDGKPRKRFLLQKPN